MRLTTLRTLSASAASSCPATYHKADFESEAPLPLLSVIIPCFNYAEYVGDAIESVLSQGAPDVEVIVVDDGSTDESWSRILEYADRVTAVRLENGGVINACLTGFSRSRGAFVHFLDADDMLCPQALKMIRPHLQRNVSKVQFMLLPVDRTGLPAGRAFPSLRSSADSHRLIDLINRFGCYATPPTSGNIYRRDVYENIGDLNYDFGIDGVAYLLAPFLGRVISIDRPLAKYRIHDSNMSAYSTLTAARMERYGRAFIDRLMHLNELLRSRELNRDLHIKRNYAYVEEHRLMGRVMCGERPGLAALVSHIRATAAEQRGLTLVASIAYALLLVALPAKSSSELIRLRVDPSSAKLLRAALRFRLAPAPSAG